MDLLIATTAISLALCLALASVVLAEDSDKTSAPTKKVLLTALSTLVAVDHVTPIPLLLARAAIIAAQDESKKDKTVARRLLETANSELQRAKDLGYAGNDPEYASLNDQITNLEKQLRGNEDTTKVFAQLKEKLASFLKRQSDREQREQRSR